MSQPLSTKKLTKKQQEMLDEIKREHVWADAHHVSCQEFGATPGHVEFHMNQYDRAIKARNELLAQAPKAVRETFTAIAIELTADPWINETSIEKIDARLAELTKELNIILDARKENWRNYRSPASHAAVAMWRKEIGQLNNRKTYLKITA